MSLFQCSKCGAVENTACCMFWSFFSRKKPPLCSECETGKWHGMFEKRDAVGDGYYYDAQGFIYHPDSVDKEKMEWTYNRNFKMVGLCQPPTTKHDSQLQS